MRIETKYVCGICGYKYSERYDCLACEQKGHAVEYPIGCIYGDLRKGAFYEDITFAVAENIPDKMNPHLNNGGSWACRDNGSGDSLGDFMCGGSFLTLNEHNCFIDKNHPTFKRMVTWLESQDIPVSVWDGKKAVPFPLTKYTNIG